MAELTMSAIRSITKSISVIQFLVSLTFKLCIYVLVKFPVKMQWRCFYIRNPLKNWRHLWEWHEISCLDDRRQEKFDAIDLIILKNYNQSTLNAIYQESNGFL